MNCKSNLVFVACSFLLMSCGTYLPAKLMSRPTPIHLSDSTGMENRGSIELHSGGTYENESNKMIQASYQGNYTMKYGSIGGLAAVYVGSHEVKNVEGTVNQGKSMSYQGFSPELRAAVYIPYNGNRTGFFSGLGWFSEGGEYADFVSEHEVLHGVFDDEESTVRGSTSGVLWNVGFLHESRIDEDNRVSIQMSQGFPGFSNFSFTVYMKKNAYSVAINPQRYQFFSLGYSRGF